MAKIAVVYWSGTGNTEAMAGLVAEGAREAGAEVDVMTPDQFGPDKVGAYDGFALGCPAMGDEELEDAEFEPMYQDVEPELAGRRTVLFGSYDWNEGQWMDIWRERAESAGIDVLDAVIAKDYPDDDAAAECRRIGALIPASGNPEPPSPKRPPALVEQAGAIA